MMTMVGSAHRIDVTTSRALERISVRIDALERSLRSGFSEGLAENRRHSDALFKSLRDDIRMIAEGVVALDAKFDRRLPP